MATTTYTVVNGEVLEENRGGTIRGYVPDVMGSTIALLNSSQTMTDTWVYWPFGEVKTRTGSTQTPFAFQGATQRYTHGAIVFFNPTYKPSIVAWLNAGGLDESDFSWYAEYQSPLNPVGQEYRAIYKSAYDCYDCADGLELTAIRNMEAWRKKHGVPQGTFSGLANAMQHCIWTCRMAKKCGVGCAQTVSDLHEFELPFGLKVRGFRPPGPPDPPGTCMDLFNNRRGINCRKQDCTVCCDQLAQNGDLAVVDWSGDEPKRFKKPKQRCKEPGKVKLPNVSSEGASCPL